MKNNLGDLIIEKIGGEGKYQILLGICLFIMGFCSDFYYFYVPLMETPPIGEYYLPSGERIEEEINYKICNNFNYTIIVEKSKDTIFYEYDIFCSEWKASVFGAAICLGTILGTIFLGYFQKFGRKICVIIASCMIIFLTPIIFVKNFYLQTIGNLIFGFSNSCLFMLRNTIFTETTGNKYRSYFMNASISTGIFNALFYFYIFSENYSYKFIYVFNALLLLTILLIIIFFIVEGPRFLLMNVQTYKNNLVCKEKLKESIKYISAFNNKNLTDIEIDEIISQANENLIGSENEQLNINEYNDDSKNYSVAENLLNSENNKVLDSPSPKFKLFNFTLLFFSFFFMIIAFTFELKRNSNDLNFYFYIIEISMFVSYYIVSLMMNIKFIGRRFSIVIFLSFLVLLKIAKIILESFSDVDKSIYVIIFLIIRVFLYSCQIPMHTLINESFNMKERLKNYSFMYIFANTASLIAPFFIEYLSVRVYDWTIIGLCSLIIFIVLVFINETLNKSLSD